MVKDITLGQYLPGNSPIHQLDPRVKILAVGFLMIAVFFINSFIGFLLWGGWLALLVSFTKIHIRYIWRGVKPIFFLIILTVLIHFFLTPGEPLYYIGPFSITIEGFERGVVMGLRIFSLVLVTSLLTLTTSPISLTNGLESLMNPFRRIGVPAHELAMMMTIALRFIPTLLEEAEKIMKAQQSRGMDFSSGSIIKRVKNVVPLLVPLFVSAFRRADDLALAMESRCYRGGIGRTRMKELVFTKKDVVAFVSVLVISLALVIIG